jgi:thiamine kinase-like enzyme
MIFFTRFSWIFYGFGIHISILGLVLFIDPAVLGEESNDNKTCLSRSLEMLRCAFPDVCTDQIHLSPINEGLSQSQIFKVEKSGQLYVIRLNDPIFAEKNRRELFVFQEASKRGVAPNIYYASEDGSVIVMNFVAGQRSSCRIARKKENIALVAYALRQVHTIPRCPPICPSVFDRMLLLHSQMVAEGVSFSKLDQAIGLLEHLRSVQISLSHTFVTAHGDLHSGNIFFTDTGVKFIDWAENSWEDSFYDLSCFALCHDYQLWEEDFLLTCYLGYAPGSEEKTLYAINKCIDYIYFSIDLLSTANKMSIDQKTDLNRNNIVYDWSFYINVFEDDKNNLTPQFLYDFGMCALKNFHQSLAMMR